MSTNETGMRYHMKGYTSYNEACIAARAFFAEVYAILYEAGHQIEVAFEGKEYEIPQFQAIDGYRLKRNDWGDFIIKFEAGYPSTRRRIAHYYVMTNFYPAPKLMGYRRRRRSSVTDDKNLVNVSRNVLRTPNQFSAKSIAKFVLDRIQAHKIAEEKYNKIAAENQAAEVLRRQHLDKISLLNAKYPSRARAYSYDNKSVVLSFVGSLEEVEELLKTMSQQFPPIKTNT